MKAYFIGKKLGQTRSSGNWNHIEDGGWVRLQTDDGNLWGQSQAVSDRVDGVLKSVIDNGPK
jgi:hypothetical protein